MKSILDQLAATSSRNEKIRILEASNGTHLTTLLQRALNPFVTYGVKQLPQVKGEGYGHWHERETIEVLEALAKRELTGNAAKAAIARQLARVTPDDAEVLRRILLKDLRCGIDASTVNAAIPGLIPVFDCMLAQPYSEKRLGDIRLPVMVQAKLDGVRALSRVDLAARDVKFYSRSGKQFTSFESLVFPLLNAIDHASGQEAWAGEFLHPVCWLDGEVTTGDFLKTVSEVRRKNTDAQDAVYNVFDVLPAWLFEGQGDCDWTARERLNFVNMVAGERVTPISTAWAKSHDEILERYMEMRSQGIEGVIVKDASAPYVKKRSYSWMKIKDFQSLDLEVVAYQEGTGKYEGKIGALVVNVDGVDVAVGSGLTDELRAEHPQAFLGRLIEVGYHEKMASGSLRHPRFIRFRDALTGAKE